MEEKIIITEPFYLDKFMEIQRQNIVLSNLLRDIAANENLRKEVENTLGPNTFNILQDTPA
jgi:hypothetical protein